MRLIKARVTNYRSITDSGWVEVASNVLCLVGKNESGKTSFLKALEKLNPLEEARGEFDFIKDYPRKGLTGYRKVHEANPATVVQAEFLLDDADLEVLAEKLGAGAVVDKNVLVSIDYKGTRSLHLKSNEEIVVRYAISTSGLSADVLEKLATATTLEQMKALAEADATLNPAIAKLNKLFPEGVEQRITDAVWEMAPKFLYFDDYSVLEGRVPLPRMVDVAAKAAAKKKVDAKDLTFLALLELAGTTPKELIDSRTNFENLKSGLEAAAIEITTEVFQFWTQNKNLRVEFSVGDPDTYDNIPPEKGPVFHTRIWNDRHMMTVSFDERSKGFVWFFSFLAYSSRVKNSSQRVIMLLDEPGLSLHAMAQADFLRFIEQRLAASHQVIYTTHSPFMVDPDAADRVRIVEDRDTVGTVITNDYGPKTNHDTLYPLMAALGISLSQMMFAGPNTLLVEGPSEFRYFPALSKLLGDKKRTVLDPRWTITPINGADKAPAFVSLFGARKLHLAVVLDFEPKKTKLLETLRAHEHLSADRVLPLTEITGTKEADIEDLFDTDYYLQLVNDTYRAALGGKTLTQKDLTSAGSRIIPRLEHYFDAHHVANGKFSHLEVADYFARTLDKLPDPPQATLERWEKLFTRLNAVIAAK